MPPRSHRLATTALALLWLAACAAVPWPRASLPLRAGSTGPGGLLDLRGVVHVHTRASHDSPASVQDVVAAARSAGVTWVAFTEHPEPGLVVATRGRVDGVTLLPGYELRAAGGSLLAIDLSEKPAERLDPASLVRWIHARGGLAFVGHFERSRLADPALYAEAAPDGLEIVNLHALANQANALGVVTKALLLPARLGLRSLLNSPIQNLERWEKLPQADAIVGSVDAHAKYRVLGPLGGTVDRYRDVFRTITTHVWSPSPEPDAIVEALRAGRSYVAFEGLAPVGSFHFELAAGRAYLEAPGPARLALVCDAVEAATATGARAILAIPAEARRCRAEAWLDERLWVVTSYRRIGPAEAPPRGGTGAG